MRGPLPCRRGLPRTGEDIVVSIRTSCAMDSATAAIVLTGRPRVREHVWNWSLIAVLIGCLSFWSAVILGIALAV